MHRRTVAERALEDHEDVLAVHREATAFTSSRAPKFVFRRDYLKYGFLHETEVSVENRSETRMHHAPISTDDARPRVTQRSLSLARAPVCLV